MDLGLAAAAGAVDTDELSQSSSEEERSRSPGNNAENENNNEESVVVDHDKKGLGRGIDEREDSPEQGSQGWGANKIARFSSSKNIDQTEATIRKPRVSVRARSEAPLGPCRFQLIRRCIIHLFSTMFSGRIRVSLAE